MSIPVVCPTCDHSFSVREEYAGKRGKCPSCGSVFRAGSAGSGSGILSPKPGFRGGRPGGSSASGHPQPSRQESSVGVADQGDSDPFSSGGFAIEDPLSPSARVGGGGGSSGRRQQGGRQQGGRQQGGRQQGGRPQGNGAMPVWGWLVMGVMAIMIFGLGVSAYVISGKGTDEIARLNDNLKKSKRATRKAKDKAGKERKERADADAKKTDDAEDEKKERYVRSPAKPLRKVDFNFRTDVMPAIVKVISTQPPGGHGTGFIINDDGWIVTNRHVIKDIMGAKIQTSTLAEYEVEGVIAIYPLQDLAIIKCKKKILGMKVLRLTKKDSVFKTGMDVWAAGNPGNARFTVTRGIVTRVIAQTTLSREGMEYDYPLPGNADADVMMLEMDARIFPGNSGGPLLNENMEVVGVNTLQGFYPMMVPGLRDPKKHRRDLIPTFGLAVHVRYIHKMLEESKDNELMSFAEAKKVADTKEIESRLSP